MSKTNPAARLRTALKAFGPEARAFWSKKEKGPQGQPSPYECALGLAGRENLATTLLAVWADLGFPY